VTEQEVVAPALSREDVHVNLVSESPTLMVRTVLTGEPPTIAVRFAVLPADTVATFAMNVTLDAPLGTVTLDGTVTAGLSDEIVTRLDWELVGAKEGAPAGTTSVHFAEPGAITTAGAHVSVDDPLPAINATCVAAVVLFKAAVIEALVAVEITPAVTVKLLCVCPAVTITLAGTESNVVFEESATVTGVELVAVKVTKQVVLWLLVRLAKVQVIPEI
jgi:hypothetical protein